METTTETRLSPSLKKWALANKDKVRVNIKDVYFDWDLAEKITKSIDSFTKEDFFAIKNEEQKRVVSELLGDRLGELMEWEEVCQDQFGILVATMLDDQIAMAVHVKCSTTKRPYYLFVPANLEQALIYMERGGAEDMPWWTKGYERSIWPASGKMESARQAVAWTFYRETGHYHPLIET